MNSPTYTLQLSLDEVNIILKALGALPFSEVYGLIHSIHQQAAAQSEAGNAGAGNAEGPH